MSTIYDYPGLLLVSGRKSINDARRRSHTDSDRIQLDSIQSNPIGSVGAQKRLSPLSPNESEDANGPERRSIGFHRPFWFVSVSDI